MSSLNAQKCFIFFAKIDGVEYNEVVLFKYYESMLPEHLSEVKAEVQKILDNHLEDDKRFSIQDLDEESTFLLIGLLLEKDATEREKIWDRIHKKVLTCEKNIEIDIEKVLEIKDKLDTQKNSVSSLNDLKNLMSAENLLNESLKNI